MLWRLADGAGPNGPHVALVSGADAPLLPVTLPPGLTGAARERVAERQLIEALSLPSSSFEMHPIQTKGEKTWSRIVLVEAERAQTWRAQLSPSAVALLPDYMALPTARGLWSIHVQAEHVVARLGPEDGFSGEVELAGSQLARAKEPKAILRLGDGHAALDDVLAGFDLPILNQVSEIKSHGLKLLRWADCIGGLDLKAPPSAAIDRIRASLKRWRTSVLAASCAAAAYIGTLWIETRQAETEAALADRRIQSLVRQHFVPAGPILDVRAQVSSALEAALEPDVIQIQGIPALTQFQIAAETLTRDGAQVLNALYEPETGLETAVAADSFSILDDIIIGLQDADFLVEQIESRSEQSGGVVARLRLELFE